MLFRKKRAVVESSDETLTNNFNITPEVKLKPIKLNKPPVINSEKPIFFGVKGKKSITLLTKNITKIILILKSSCKKSITITYSTNSNK